MARSRTVTRPLGLPVAVTHRSSRPFTSRVTRGTARNARWFGAALAIVAAAACAVRVAYVLVDRRDFNPGGDAYFYHAGANLLADGKGFIEPYLYPLAHSPAAEHPPLYLIFLSVPSFLGMHSVLTHLLWSCLLGTATVILVGLVGRAVAGERVGIIAALVAALYPNIWAPDGMLQAESLAMFFTMLAVLLAYRYWRRPSLARVVLLGAACGAGALARSELWLLVPLLVLPLALRTRDRPIRDRLAWCGAATLAAALAITPWTIYNATRFEHPIVLSSQLGPLLSAANCDSTYYGNLQGYYDIGCTMQVDRRRKTTHDDQSIEDQANRRAAFAYIRGHLSRLPTVERVRLQRILGLYKPSLYVHEDALLEGRDLWVSWAGLWSFYGLALLSIAGTFVLVRRRDSRVPVLPLLAPIVVVVLTVLATYASTRFRAIAEPSLAILAAVAVEWLVRGIFLRARHASRRLGYA
jgi:4-amino-4-deoxy-L-arabinose transferase-like glycosyltransferase